MKFEVRLLIKVIFCVIFFSIPILGQLRSAERVVYEKPFVFLITSYNNSDWYKKNLDSVFSQNYWNYRIVYVDDCSPDGTADLVEAYVTEKNQWHRFTLVRNENRALKMENFYNAVHNHCRDEEVVMDLDGDDWLQRNDALQIMNRVYADPEIWTSYCPYVMWPKHFGCGCEPFPEWVHEKNAYREYPWITASLRAFYGWLFKMIRVEDLKIDGKFFDTTCDLGYMFPMLEMSGGRTKFIPDVLYVYNRDNPINDFRQDFSRQQYVEAFIRGLPRYERLALSMLRQ